MTPTEMQIILPDIPRFFTALAEWLACILCLLEMKRRYSRWKMVSVSVGALVLQAAFLEFTGDMEGIW